MIWTLFGNYSCLGPNQFVVDLQFASALMATPFATSFQRPTCSVSQNSSRYGGPVEVRGGFQEFESYQNK